MFSRLLGSKKKPSDQKERNATRFPVTVRVTLVLENGAVVQGVLKDMSTRGMLMHTHDYPFGLVVGEEGDVGLAPDNPIEGAQMRFPCEVVRVGRDGVALRFLIQAEGQEGKFYPEDFMAK